MALRVRRSKAPPPPPGCPMAACMAVLGGAWIGGTIDSTGAVAVAGELVTPRRDLAHQTGHALKHRFHRLGADRHDAILDLAGQVFEFLQPGAHIR